MTMQWSGGILSMSNIYAKKNAEKKILNEVSESKIKYMNDLSLFFNKVQFNDTNLKINYKRILKPSSK